MNYEEFLESKKKLILPTGKIVKPESVHKMLFEFQRDIVVWAVKPRSRLRTLKLNATRNRKRSYCRESAVLSVERIAFENGY